MPEYEGKISDEALSELRDRIGVEIDLPEPYMSEANIDNFRRWAYGLGIENPLYTDPEYGGQSEYGMCIAPPTFLNPTARIRASGLPGVHGMYAGDTWTWHKRVYSGYKIRSKARLTDVIERETDYAGRSIQQIHRVDFYNQYNEHLATRDYSVFRMEREDARSGDKYDTFELAEWSEDDIERFKDHYLQEERRGAETRYFEDVSVGEELDTLLKGPVSPTSEITFLRGWGGPFTEAHRPWYRTIHDKPALAIPNKYGVPEPPERVHWSDTYANENGVPAAYDYGPERVGWLAHVASHWMSDDGFLKSLEVQLRAANLNGDVMWCSGEVTDKRREGDEHLVDIDLVGKNQRDATSAKGHCVVKLPSRE